MRGKLTEDNSSEHWQSGLHVIMQYHVMITLQNRRKDILSANMCEEDLLVRVVNPYNKGLKFGIEKEVISPDNIKQIKITKTQGLLFDDAYGDFWNSINSAEDVTAKYIFKQPSIRVNTSKIELQKSKRLINKRIFIVHGKDEKTVLELKNMLISFGLDPVILHEQPGGSRTIVEKLEKYSDVGFAFVILTPDDVCCETSNFSQMIPLLSNRSGLELSGFLLSAFKNRARQNVILEFGFFIGKLGRERVCCLLKGDVEKPSDMDGILYVPFIDSINEKKDAIFKELIEAKYNIESH